MHENHVLDSLAVRRMANGKLICPRCGGELLLVEKGLLCVDGECDEIYDIKDGKPIYFVSEGSEPLKQYKKPVTLH